MKFTKIMAMLLVAAMLFGCDVAVKVPAVEIVLSDSGITVDGKPASTDEGSAVYTAGDIVYYEAGRDFTYGEGTEKDAHTAEEAAAHTVVHITRAGTYRLSGKLSAGQIAVDLGKKAEDDPSAVVTLILNGVDITCTVAPAIIFYNVYECGDKDDAKKNVDTSRAGANVLLAEGSENFVTGSYVARIYKPDSVELSDDGTKVEDAKKLHKYDAAFYSKMSMNISGGGTLNIQAENEGLDSELHLTVNGGNIHITSGNDGINTNEDGVSVTTINGGKVHIRVSGQTGEGDGIDSNGWLVVNGGEIVAQACGSSMDSGIDSDMGIHINGGTVIATGNMLDILQEGGQTYAVFSMEGKVAGGQTVTMKDESGKVLLEHTPANDWSILVYSSDGLKPGTYTLWLGEQQLAGRGGEGGKGFGRPGGFDGERPEGMQPGERPAGMQPGERPEGMQPDERPEGMQPGERPEGMQPGERPEGMQPGEDFGRPGGTGVPGDEGQSSTRFVITEGANMFGAVAPTE